MVQYELKPLMSKLKRLFRNLHIYSIISFVKLLPLLLSFLSTKGKEDSNAVCRHSSLKNSAALTKKKPQPKKRYPTDVHQLRYN